MIDRAPHDHYLQPTSVAEQEQEQTQRTEPDDNLRVEDLWLSVSVSNYFSLRE
jgi:hypothetical protein